MVRSKIYFCPSRRTPAVDTPPQVHNDYVTARHDTFGPAGVNAAYFSVLGGNEKAEGSSFAFTGTTLTAVTNAAGTANTILLAHKGIKPQNYSATGDSGWDSGWNAAGRRLNNDARFLGDNGSLANSGGKNTDVQPVQDSNTLSQQKGFGSPHPGACRCCSLTVRSVPTRTATAPVVIPRVQPLLICLPGTARSKSPLRSHDFWAG